MKTMLKLTLVLLLMGLSTVALADENADDNGKPLFSLTPYVGMGLWSDDTGLDNSLIFGGRAAWHMTRRFALEGHYGMSTAEATDTATDFDLKHYGADLVFDLMPDARIVPYLTAGWAQIDLEADGSSTTHVLNGPGAGIGLKTRLWGDSATNGLLRFDVRDVMSNLTSAFPNNGDLTHNFVATAGLQFSFGKSSKDTDGDGVRDQDDLCADTPPGALVDATGCPTDGDGDGVFDGLDECTDTPVGALADATGCAYDTDGDGVLDGLDRCDDTDPNLAVDEHGCPIEVVTVERVPFEAAQVTGQRIRFDVDKSDVRLSENARVHALAGILAEWTELELEITGHADETGGADYNQALSERRAAAVRKAILQADASIDGARITTKGMGETQPLDTNDTEQGRQANRRVEFKVLNAGDLSREVEIRKLMER
jgi:OOP family OmpA-OmpF porin